MPVKLQVKVKSKCLKRRKIVMLTIYLSTPPFWDTVRKKTNELKLECVI